MMNTSAAAPSPASSDSTAELKSAAKWLVAASGSIAALLVAGMQLKDMRLAGWPVALAATGSALVALGAVGVVLWTAISVLATPRSTLTQLAEQDRADNGMYPLLRDADPKSPLIYHLVIERKLELLGPKRDAIVQLETDRSAAYRFLFGAQKVEIGGRDYDPLVKGDVSAVQGQSLDLAQRIERVLDAAEHWEVRRRFSRLTSMGAIAGGVFVVGILGFVWLTSTPVRSPKLTQPIPVVVVTPSAMGQLEALGLAPECAGQKLKGTAVGGTLEMPVVVIEGTSTCPPQRIGPSKHLVVLPVGSASR